MGAMFQSPKMPAVQPLPASPIQDEARKREQEAAADSAVVDAVQSGRRTTMFAGQELAMNKQMARSKRRSAAAEDIGAL